MTAKSQEALGDSSPLAPATIGLWTAQISSIVRIELRRSLFGRRAILTWLLAVTPVLLVLSMALFPPTARWIADADVRANVWAYLFETLVLRAVIFFGCAWSFMNLFRGEIVDRSLHYSLLAAVRRDVLVAGKYIAGVLAAVSIYLPTVLLSIALTYLPMRTGDAWRAITSGGGLKAAAGYATVTILACVGYGAAFMAMGLFFRNPIFPALLAYGWEFINFLLPPVLKQISIVHFLRSISPVRVSEGPFAILAEPTAWWIAVPTLLILSSILTVLSGWRLRRYEIQYGVD
ncbi:MAG: hypothetical protein IT175_17085 [Acidobacteria bacterium]|nr:hypothetical protein [Acidobacteriota bacterium]